MEALQNNTMREVTPYQPADWGAGQNLSFRCMQTALALPIDRVREIIEYGQVTTVPMMPGYVRGVLNLRGNVVPVIDLAFRFGSQPTEVGRRTCIIILELPIGKTSQLAGLIVDAVDEVLDIEQSQIERLRSTLAGTYGQQISLNVEIDPSILGGMVVQIAGEIIDGSVSTRLQNLKLQLVKASSSINRS